MILISLIALSSTERPWFALVDDGKVQGSTTASIRQIIPANRPLVDEHVLYTEPALPPLSACNNEIRAAVSVESLQSYFPL